MVQLVLGVRRVGRVKEAPQQGHDKVGQEPAHYLGHDVLPEARLHAGEVVNVLQV